MTSFDKPQQITGFSCGHKRTYCSSHDCGRPAARLCCFPVKRDGEQAQCDRPVCASCLVRVGELELCASHGRVEQAKARRACP